MLPRFEQKNTIFHPAFKIVFGRKCLKQHSMKCCSNFPPRHYHYYYYYFSDTQFCECPVEWHKLELSPNGTGLVACGRVFMGHCHSCACSIETAWLSLHLLAVLNKSVPAVLSICFATWFFSGSHEWKRKGWWVKLEVWPPRSGRSNTVLSLFLSLHFLVPHQLRSDFSLPNFFFFCHTLPTPPPARPVKRLEGLVIWQFSTVCTQLTGLAWSPSVCGLLLPHFYHWNTSQSGHKIKPFFLKEKLFLSNRWQVFFQVFFLNV